VIVAKKGVENVINKIFIYFLSFLNFFITKLDLHVDINNERTLCHWCFSFSDDRRKLRLKYSKLIGVFHFTLDLHMFPACFVSSPDFSLVVFQGIKISVAVYRI